jgi:hypothetical protein
MLMTGLGFAYNAIGPYVVAAQQALVFGALTLYVIMGRSREPTTPGPVR